nr:MAG TPA: hypothetical protein [Caudoviricetes sp.]
MPVFFRQQKSRSRGKRKPPEGGCGLEADYFFSFLTSFRNFLKSLPIG